MAITSETVKKLREKTGAGMMDCKRALEETNGDMEKAIEYLRKKGAATAEKRADRVANQGIVVTKLRTAENSALSLRSTARRILLREARTLFNSPTTWQ